MIKDILNRQPIARMGAPVRSWQSRGAELIQTPGADIGYVTGGNIVSGLTNALKSGLGFYGAIKDTQAQRAYNENLAQLAEQERQDKLAQAAAEEQYKQQVLAQQAELARQQLEAQANAATARYAHEKEMEGIRQRNAVALQQAQLQKQQEAKDLALRQQGIDPTRYGYDEEYTKQINDLAAAKAAEEKRQEHLNKLVESGKYSPEDVDIVRENPQQYTLYSEKVSPILSFFGYNPTGVVKKKGPQSPLQAPKEQKTQAQKELDKLWGE